MDLDPLQVNGACTNGLAHLDAIAGGVVSVGGWQVEEVRTVLCEQRVLREVRAKASCCQDHGTFLREVLAFLFVAHTADSAVVHQQLLHLGLVDDARQVRALRNLLHHLNQSIGNGHAWEALLATVGTRRRVAAQARQQGHVQVELVDKPVHVRAAVAAQHLDKFRLLGTALQRVRSEQVHGIIHLLGLLCHGLGTIDATGGLGGVASAEGRLVHQHHLAAALQDAVGG
mmetsp:Transcript_10244/g.19131  ORF Transcript_10244/g.19131 Transcript_10244/m.19131 type:complete len:229 (+) Transcript_10244:975-1661(+)